MRISDWSSDVCSSDLRPGHSSPDALERLVVVLGPEELAAPAGHDPSRSTVLDAGRLDGVLVIGAAGPVRENPLALAEDDAVALIGIGAAVIDPLQGPAGLLGQVVLVDARKDLNRLGAGKGVVVRV